MFDHPMFDQVLRKRVDSTEKGDALDELWTRFGTALHDHDRYWNPLTIDAWLNQRVWTSPRDLRDFSASSLNGLVIRFVPTWPNSIRRFAETSRTEAPLTARGHILEIAKPPPAMQMLEEWN
jgi:hypothetical protein